jgi:hypothetical protein
MAETILFSSEGLKLSLSVNEEERVATISLTLEDLFIEKQLKGKQLIAFYRATRRLISRANKINYELLGIDRSDIATEVILYLIKKGINGAEFAEIYQNFISKLSAEQKIKYFPAQKNLGSQNVKAEVFIALPQHEIDLFSVERIQNATGDFMEAMGFELEVQDEPVFGSFYQRLKYLLNGEVKTEAAEIYKKGKTALELQFVSVPSAEATNKLSEAAASLITSLNGIDEAAIRLGAILLVKVSKDGVSMILAETVSPELALLLDKNPQLLKNPSVVFDLISTIRVSEKPIEEGTTEVIE